MSKYVDCAKAIELLKEKSHELRLISFSNDSPFGFTKYTEKVVETQTAIEVLISLSDADVFEYKKGKWQKDSDGLPVCPCCGETALQRLHITVPGQIADVRLVKSPFCPWCGADLSVGEK